VVFVEGTIRPIRLRELIFPSEVVVDTAKVHAGVLPG
jgi:hypothetical protein